MRSGKVRRKSMRKKSSGKMASKKRKVSKKKPKTRRTRRSTIKKGTKRKRTKKRMKGGTGSAPDDATQAEARRIAAERRFAAAREKLVELLATERRLKAEMQRQLIEAVNAGNNDLAEQLIREGA